MSDDSSKYSWDSNPFNLIKDDRLGKKLIYQFDINSIKAIIKKSCALTKPLFIALHHR